MTQREKAETILRHLSGGKSGKMTPGKEKALMRVMDALDEIETKEPTRTISEVQGIVDCVRAGIPVCVDYYDENDNFAEDAGIIMRPCW